jgi:hypothetical protein
MLPPGTTQPGVIVPDNPAATAAAGFSWEIATANPPTATSLAIMRAAFLSARMWNRK